MTNVEQKQERIRQLELRLKELKGSHCEVYSRIVGYHRPLDNWNDGKKEEFKARFNYLKTL